jgi:ABC-type spermidine/putrescine transport system permease subunit I
MSRVILFALGAFSLLSLLDAFTFTSVSNVLQEQTGHEVDVRVAIIALVIFGAATGLAVVAMTMKSMGTWVPAKRETSKSTNPWTAIDRGDDPTI